jgi:tetratricopeptide (TPR) repeat protein
MVILASCIGLSGAAPQAPSDESADIDLLINARMQLRDGKVDLAQESTQDFLRKHPASAQAHFLLGFILFRKAQAKAAVGLTQEQAKASLAEYTEGAKYRNPSSLDLKIVALDYVLLESFEDADKWLSRSLAWNPKDPEAWYYMGRIKYSENKLPEAAQAFEQCLRLDPQYTKAEAGRKQAVAAESAAH